MKNWKNVIVALALGVAFAGMASAAPALQSKHGPTYFLMVVGVAGIVFMIVRFFSSFFSTPKEEDGLDPVPYPVDYPPDFVMRHHAASRTSEKN